MTADEVRDLLLPLTLSGVLILLIAYVLLMPDNAQKVAGWLWSGIARVVRKADRTAVAMRVQGAVNSARGSYMRDAPDDVMKGKLKIKWADAEEALAVAREGEVVVFMQQSSQHEENVALALMAYIPKSVVPRARPYVPHETMRAVDLTLAKSILAYDDATYGVLETFYSRHLDPARAESEEIKTKLGEMDTIDLHGWLSRILLNEFRHLGEQLHPGEPDDVCKADAEEFAKWLHALAARAPGQIGSLDYEGRYLRVAVIHVAIAGKLAEEGLRPYRKRAKQLLYGRKFDAVYLLARDRNISAVEELAEDLEVDGLVANATRYTYRLRPDYGIRVLQREKAICVCLRARRAAPEPNEAIEDPDHLPEETDECLEAPESQRP